MVDKEDERHREWKTENDGDRENGRVGEKTSLCNAVIALKLHVFVILFNESAVDARLISYDNKGTTVYLLSV